MNWDCVNIIEDEEYHFMAYQCQMPKVKYQMYTAKSVDFFEISVDLVRSQ